MSTPEPFTDTELEAGTRALYDSAKGRMRPWVQYADLTPEGAALYRDKASVVLSAVAPLIAARVAKPYQQRIAALEALLACYRTGRRPSGKLLDRLDKTREAIARLPRSPEPGSLAAGYSAGLAWLTTDAGREYLTPDVDEAPVPALEDAADEFVQGFHDAIKEVAWHVQRPGEPCHAGERCPAMAYLLAYLHAYPQADPPDVEGGER